MKSCLPGVGSNCPSRLSPRYGIELSRLLADDFEMSRLLAGDYKIRRLWESARDSNPLLPSPQWRGGGRSLRGRLYPAYEGLAWLQCTVSLEISIAARHCCHACPDLSLSGRRTVPTTAYLYGPETAGPPFSGRTEDGESAL